MGDKGKKDETANRAVSNVNREFIPMNIVYYNVKRSTRKDGDTYSMVIKAASLGAGGVTRSDTIASYDFHESVLSKMCFRVGDSDMTIGEANVFCVGNILGRTRRRIDSLKERVRSYIRESYRRSDMDDSEIYVSVVQTLRSLEYNKIFREIAMLEALQKMALKSPNW